MVRTVSMNNSREIIPTKKIFLVDVAAIGSNENDENPVLDFVRNLGSDVSVFFVTDRPDNLLLPDDIGQDFAYIYTWDEFQNCDIDVIISDALPPLNPKVYLTSRSHYIHTDDGVEYFLKAYQSSDFESAINVDSAHAIAQVVEERAMREKELEQLLENPDEALFAILAKDGVLSITHAFDDSVEFDSTGFGGADFEAVLSDIFEAVVFGENEMIAGYVEEIQQAAEGADISPDSIKAAVATVVIDTNNLQRRRLH